ncbi:unnamed protein product, partial [Mesorhabditis belari]|uniref:UMP-CMP kinase n=1 Tax=Mesorhabditis belari TaxID=2138241 RepID=A0AAF3F1V3_9BILA
MSNLYKVVFVLGPPGSGKGTQCALIQKNFGLVHLSAGDLLREEQESKSQYGQLIAEHIRNGTIVPVAITCALLENAMKASGDCAGFLIDGFPRNQDNLDGWQKNMADKVDVKFTLYLSCKVDVCVSRCLNRKQGRADDNEESLRKRIHTYNTQTYPIIEYYEKLGLVREVATCRDTDEVYTDIEKIFKEAGF